MLEFVRARLTYANVIATAALALGIAGLAIVANYMVGRTRP